MSELELYKIPQANTSLADTSNPANLGAGGAAIDNSTSNPTSGGMNEQQVRDIVNSVRNNMTEARVREIVAGMQKFLTGQNVLIDGIQRSQNFVPNTAGWQWTPDSVEINTGIFNIGGTQITIDNTQDIQENLDLISDSGGGTLFLQNGTYTLTADISIPSGVTLQGVSRDGVILDCNTSFAVKIAGTNVYSTGTVAINNGDTTVVGTGTTWTSAMVGRFIWLDGLWYEITARTDNTHITITTYQGDNLSGATYVLANINTTGVLEKVTVTGATGSGVVVQYASEPQLKDIFVTSCGLGVEMDYVLYPVINLTSNKNGVNLDINNANGFYVDFCDFSFSTTGAGVILANCEDSTFFNSTANDNTGDGVNMTSCVGVVFVSIDISGNGGQGMEMVSGCNDNYISSGSFDGNGSDGIKLTATNDRNTFVSISVINSGGYGINVAASTCDNNQIIAPAFDNNTSGNINDQGMNTTIFPLIYRSVVPQPDFFCNTTSSGAMPGGTNTTGYFGRVVIPYAITASKFTFKCESVGTAGTLDIALFSEDGQKQIFSFTTASITTTGIKTTAFTATTIPAGTYYIAINTNSTANIVVLSFKAPATGNLLDIASEPIFSGTMTITASTMPASFDPTALTYSEDGTMQFRLDN